MRDDKQGAEMKEETSFQEIAMHIRMMSRFCRSGDVMTCEFGNDFTPRVEEYLRDCFEKRERVEEPVPALEVGSKVVATQQMMTVDIEGIEEGMLFVYRGRNEMWKTHEFAPDYAQGHRQGFVVDDDDFNSTCFRKQFVPVGEW